MGGIRGVAEFELPPTSVLSVGDGFGRLQVCAASRFLATDRPLSSEVKRLGLVRRTEVLRNG